MTLTALHSQSNFFGVTAQNTETYFKHTKESPTQCELTSVLQMKIKGNKTVDVVFLNLNHRVWRRKKRECFQETQSHRKSIQLSMLTAELLSSFWKTLGLKG